MIAQRLKEFEKLLAGTSCRLVAVSKTKPIPDLMEAYSAGQRLFGENKVQEMCEKQPAMPPDIEWHLIGHLQTNKVKYIVPFVALIQSVDSWRLLEEINKRASKVNRIINCLLQIHIAQEETKFGLDEKGLEELLQNPLLPTLSNIRILGLMGMATNTNDQQQIRKEFRYLRHLFDSYAKNLHTPNVLFQELSMGMSNDYKIAIEEGSTLIRIGSAIFGSR
ncbi:MAG: YggS family pyridoxal phosphate-dependent enzyme [Cytophagales bacterium]|nr:YggS family pyridoxal phosphate-dependent enzyme [Cytophagales bacterium]MDW8383567.1 YggS family pyridoxal phosphate-dependent enzyme [Flammeovirgaceae bacterium]